MIKKTDMKKTSIFILEVMEFICKSLLTWNDIYKMLLVFISRKQNNRS